MREQKLFRPGEKLLVAVSDCSKLGGELLPSSDDFPCPRRRPHAHMAIWRFALRHGYTSIVTAHTGSDCVETLLYNLFRSSSPHGLQSLTRKRTLSPVLSLTHSAAFSPTGILSSIVSPEEGTFKVDNEVALVRPVLGFTRSELREYCDRLGLALWPDASNMSLEIDRNHIRLELLPYLRENFNGSVDKSLARCAEILHAEQQYLDTICESILRRAETEDGNGKKLDIGVVQSLPVALQRRVLKRFVESFTRRSLGFDHVERLRAPTPPPLTLTTECQPRLAWECDCASTENLLPSDARETKR